MLKRLFLPIILFLTVGSIASCNSKGEEYSYVESSGAAVTAFSLKNDSKVLDSLSNVYFSIDLENGQIFNADSLPYGTKVSRLIPSIKASSGAKEITLTYYCPETKRDSVVNYISNPSDSIDFSYGPVKLTIKSQSGLVTRNYEIRVNVHKVQADSMAWYSMQSAPLPTNIQNVKAQRTIQMGDTYYCLTTDGNRYCLSTTDDPYDADWLTTELTFDFVPNVSSLRASDNSLYILADNGDLFASTDAKTWVATSQNWHYIYGGYDDQILGSVLANDGNRIVSYPSLVTYAMPSGFPVDGTSLPASYRPSMSYSTQMVLTGGRAADGTVKSATWGFDGTYWVEISNKPITRALQQMTMVPYDLVQTTNTNWAPRKYPALLAFGGITADGSYNRMVYYSRDWGMTWHQAPELLQMPNEVPAFCDATAYQHSTTMHVNSRSSAWTDLAVMQLPVGCEYTIPVSRAVAPITQWECPAIYIFGGTGTNGQALTQIWRGVIYQYTFKPVQ